MRRAGRRALAFGVALAVNAGLIGAILFTQKPRSLPYETVVEVTLMRMRPDRREPEQPHPIPARTPASRAERATTPDLPAPAPQPRQLAPPPAAAPIAPPAPAAVPSFRLRGGGALAGQDCSRGDLSRLSREERARCESAWAAFVPKDDRYRGPPLKDPGGAWAKEAARQERARLLWESPFYDPCKEEEREQAGPVTLSRCPN